MTPPGDAGFGTAQQHRHLQVRTCSEDLVILRPPFLHQEYPLRLASGFNGFNRPAKFASQGAIGLGAEQRILRLRPTSASREWRLGLWCAHQALDTLAHCYAIIAHKLCCFASRDMQTRWRNLYPFCPPIRKFQVQCQPEPDSQSLVTSAATRSEARGQRLLTSSPRMTCEDFVTSRGQHARVTVTFGARQ